MLTLGMLEGLRLASRPRGQRLYAATVLRANYGVLPGVAIDIERAERIPDEPVIFVMNHSDRYNCWPLQYRLCRERDRFTATWVKGKYYENAIIGGFMRATNNIPTVSRGYLITKDFIATLRRRPTDSEYRELRASVDAAWHGEDSGAAPPAPAGVPAELLTRRRDLLGRRFDPEAESYAQCVARLFADMMRQFVRLNVSCRELGLDLMVFPEGTRSVRLGKGHLGVSQLALFSRATVVPVGCNGSDRVYPGNSPLARRGRIVYRIGEPLTFAAMAPWHIQGAFEPFTAVAERLYARELRGLTDEIMRRIAALLEPQYLPDEAAEPAVADSRRFI